MAHREKNHADMKYKPKIALARKMFDEIAELPPEDGLYGPSNEYYLRKIVEYIDYLETTGKPPTTAGLALFIGLTRATLMNYAKDEAYAPSLGRFLQIIEMTLEENWTEGEGGATSIFLGKNMGYTDKQTVEVEHSLAEWTSAELEEKRRRLEGLLNEHGGHTSLAEQAGGGRTRVNENPEIEAVYEVIEDGGD